MSIAVKLNKYLNSFFKLNLKDADKELYKSIKEEGQIVLDELTVRSFVTDEEGDDSLFVKVYKLPEKGILKNNGVVVVKGMDIPIDSISLNYTAEINEEGQDYFTWTMSDGDVESELVDFVIEIEGVNDVPNIDNMNKRVSEDSYLMISVSDLDDHYNDVEGDLYYSIKFTSIPVNGVLFNNNSIVTVGDEILIQNMFLKYVPSLNFNGIDSYEWQFSDGIGFSNSASVTISIDSVNDHPQIQGVVVTFNEEEVYTFTSELIQSIYYDIDGSMLSKIKILSLPEKSDLFLNDEIVTLDSEILFDQISLLRIKGRQDMVGEDSMSWQFSDGDIYSNEQMVTILINDVNDKPFGRDSEIPVNYGEWNFIDKTVFTDIYRDVDGDLIYGIKLVEKPSQGMLIYNQTIAELDKLLLIDMVNFNYSPYCFYYYCTESKF